MHSFVTSKNAEWPRLIWPTLYVADEAFKVICLCITRKPLGAFITVHVQGRPKNRIIFERW